jgi:hypothetical protein
MHMRTKGAAKGGIKPGTRVRLAGTWITGGVKETGPYGLVQVSWDNHPFRTSSHESPEALEPLGPAGAAPATECAGAHGEGKP